MKIKRLIPPLGIAFIVILFGWWGFAAASPNTSAAVPTVIPYQGKLTDQNGQTINATLPMTFALYSQPENGIAAWIEPHPAVNVVDGLFTVYLGEIVPLPSAVLNNNPYLGLTVGMDSEMAPRHRMGSVPYARTLAPGAAITGNNGPLVSITNTLDAFQDGNGTALALRGTSGTGPVLSVVLSSSDQWGAAFAPAIYVRRQSGIGSWATVQSANFSEWPGLASISTLGTGLVGIAGDPGTEGYPLGGPASGWYNTLLPGVKAGVLGQSSIGPGGYFTSTLSQGILSYGSPGIQGWSSSGAPGVAGHNNNASGMGIYGTSLNHSAIAGYAGISGVAGSGTALALQKAGIAGASSLGPGGYFTSTLTGLYATGLSGPAIEAYKGGPVDGYDFSYTISASGGLVPGFSTIFGSAWAGPGVYGRSQNGSGVLGESGYSGVGPIEDPLNSLSENTGAGVLGYSTNGPGIFAWSTITHSLVVSGSAYISSDLFVGGTVTENADIAEYYVAVGNLEPGDVVVLDPDTSLGLRLSDQPYDTRVAGIISTDPAIVLPGAVDGVPLALVGRVPAKVDASFGAIQVGDLLTTSPTPGHAMLCVDRIQCIGAIIGKALEPLESGTDSIMILVTLQ